MDQYKRNKALRLEYFTVGYNLLEAVVSIAAGGAANSIALIGFGLDSIVESLSGLVLIWRLRHMDLEKAEEDKRERQAVRFVGITFWVLGAWVLFEAVRKIANTEIPRPSALGIGVAVASLIIMPLLARAKLRLGRELELRSLIADAKETIVCSLLSLALLLGLSANAAFGFWLADPLVGVIVAGYLFKEGRELLFEEECGCEEE